MVLVLANGCFDLLHVGHIRHLEEARSFGDRLVVALTLDEHVGKGHGRPVVPWAERAEMLRALRCVSEVFPSVDLASAVRFRRPNVIAKGLDWDGGLPAEDVRAAEEVSAVIRYTSSEKRSTTALIRRIKCASA